MSITLRANRVSVNVLRLISNKLNKAIISSLSVNHRYHNEMERHFVMYNCNHK